jgi:hypothetical protein
LTRNWKCVPRAGRAKRANVNKSQKIRDALAANPRKSPAEISEILKADGLVVKPQYVSTIKSNAKKLGRRGRKLAMRGTARRTRAPRTSGDSSFGAFRAALEFVKAASGIEAAKSMLATIEEVSSVV